MRSEGYGTWFMCVCLSAPFRPLRVKVSPENDTNASSRQDKENKTGDFLKNAPLKSYGVICSLCRRSAVLYRALQFILTATEAAIATQKPNGKLNTGLLVRSLLRGKPRSVSTVCICLHLRKFPHSTRD